MLLLSTLNLRGGAAMAKTAYHHGDLRAELLRQALTLIVEKGLEALTLRALARAAGVSHTAPYRHFSDKTALISALADEGFRALTDQIQGLARETGLDPLERFKNSSKAYIHFAITNPAYYSVMFSSPVLSLGRGHLQLESAKKSFQLLVEEIIECQRLGLMRAGDPLTFAVASWSMIHGAAALLADGLIDSETVEIDAVATHIVSVLCCGLRKDC
jgi:AcrR family transcriptional regulator